MRGRESLILCRKSSVAKMVSEKVLFAARRNKVAFTLDSMRHMLSVRHEEKPVESKINTDQSCSIRFVPCFLLLTS